MHIAVVIPAYNVAAFLRDAAESVIRQTHADWSAIIVDDGSTDATAVVAADYRDPRIRVVRQSNAGVSAARNAGLHQIFPGGHAPHEMKTVRRPDAVLFLDGDDWLAPHAMATLSDALDDAPWAVASCGHYARVDADGRARHFWAPQQGDLLERLLTRNLFANCGHLLIRREAIETAGDFRGDLAYGEDWEFCVRLALLGKFVGVASPDPVLFVRERPGSAYMSRATDPAAYQPALEAIFLNPGVINRLGRTRLDQLRQRAASETAWAVGRELIRHGRRAEGLHSLIRSLHTSPSMKRLVLVGLSRYQIGPFRPYGNTG